MTERESKEVARILLHVSDAKMRARRAADDLAREGAASHVVEALTQSEQALADLHRTLSQQTYYAVDDPRLRLAG